MPTPPFVPNFSDPNLTDLANALQYNPTTGLPEVRASINSTAAYSSINWKEIT